MLDSVVKLSEKISELLKYRADRRVRRFNQLIEPMYAALKEVHQDYLSIFEKTKNELNSELDLRTIANSLADRRLAEEAERCAILQHADTMSRNESLADYKWFFKTVVTYFGHTPFSGNSTPSNLLLQTLRAAEMKDSIIQPGRPSGRNCKKALLQAIEIALDELRINWKFVSLEYAKALAASAQ